MIKKELREELEDCVFFDSPSFDNSIIGISTDGKIVYLLSKMIEELMQDENWTYEDALEFIEYNTIRTLPYVPIIIVEDLNYED